MFNKFRIGAAGVALISAFGLAGTAQAADTATATAEAEILEALSLTALNSLDFGQIAVNGAGTVVVAATGGAPTCSANLICAAGTSSPGDFEVEGTAGTTVDITIGAASPLTGPGANMTLSGLNDSAGGSVVLGVGGISTFSVGGTLAVNAGQVAGTYSSTFDVTVEYQ
jgi:hypothetical protein